MTTTKKSEETKQSTLAFGLASNGGSTLQSPASQKVPPAKKDPPTTSVKGKIKVEEIYQRKTQLEHILLRPDTYIGSIEHTAMSMWVIEDEKMVHREVKYVPGLYKIFDEILVNAADNKIRDPSMDSIKVTINKEKNLISIMNNGRGVPVEMHEEEGMYVPEMIFGHLLTSSNFDDDDKKVTGGRNGFGAKLCNIFSTEFIVETSDNESGNKFKQVFNDNMSKRGKPKITNAAKQDFTRITFQPDLSRFGMTELDNDIVALLTKRVYDMAGVVKNVKVYLNDERIKIKNFKEYVKLYLDSVFGKSDTKTTILCDVPDPRWEICFALSEGQFQQVSFVNSICTSKGGTHVNMIADQIITRANEVVKKKNKGVAVKPHQVKNHIWLFINCLIENPSFDSQTKENMTLKAGKFGSKCILSDAWLTKVMKTGVIENILAFAQMKQASQLKQTDGTKRARLSGIAKLDDANNAGTRNGQKCTLILTEGDSAKALAISGLSVVGRDNFGVFPLRGKVLNVREASHKQIMDNAEINAIKQILGLKTGKEYLSTDSLRYGHVMIMTDQDHDGSHIKGLIVNIFDHFWPSLLRTSGFLLQFVTPIVKVTKGTREVNFYNIPEYEFWKEGHGDGKGWVIKYYKGLGTSTAADAKKYFSRMDDHLKPFARSQDVDREHLELAFAKNKADDRKDWLANLAAGTFMDPNIHEVPITDFVNKELILFSYADNVRSIPSVVDGLKPGQRKILFACFKRNLTKTEIKVAQLAGYVSEHSAYHHGETSLQSTIVGLAQDFCGSNNVNLLEPRGQFGTRLQGGKDSAHARYIFTRLSPIARMTFNPADDKLLTYLNEENMSIEPEWYMPILPLALVNGAEGIGTGWSTSVPNYNPRDIIANLHQRLNGEPFFPMHPWYRGFKGAIERETKRYKISGIWRKIDDLTLEITELPLGSWTQTYKEFLEGLLIGSETVEPSIKDYKEYHTDTAVHFVIDFTATQMERAEKEGLEKKFKLTNTKSMTNLVLFDSSGKLKKYESVEEIMEEFYALRLVYYQKRKDWLAGKLERELLRLENQVRFVLEVIDGTLVVHNRKRVDIVKQLRSRKFSPIAKNVPDDGPNPVLNTTLAPPAAGAVVVEAVDGNASEADDEDGREDTGVHGYDYLLSMPIWNLTMEKVAKMTGDRDAKQQELKDLLATLPADLWRRDLDAFLAQWEELEAAIQLQASKNTTTKGKKAKTINPLSGRKRKLLFRKVGGGDEDDADDGDYMGGGVRKLAKTAAGPSSVPRPSRVVKQEVPIVTVKQAPLSFEGAARAEHINGTTSATPTTASSTVKKTTTPVSRPVKMSTKVSSPAVAASVSDPDPWAFDVDAIISRTSTRSPAAAAPAFKKQQRTLKDMFPRATETRKRDLTVEPPDDVDDVAVVAPTKKLKTPDKAVPRKPVTPAVVPDARTVRARKTSRPIVLDTDDDDDDDDEFASGLAVPKRRSTTPRTRKPLSFDSDSADGDVSPPQRRPRSTAARIRVEEEDEDHSVADLGLGDEDEDGDEDEVVLEASPPRAGRAPSRAGRRPESTRKKIESESDEWEP
ncbi:DNA topoisomerase 2 [Thoreauomyces humboldtii]|nr:DNA topoisomerase 2 [Thoreauomyces humboldtii]